MALAVLADIGGTNTRVALAEGGRVQTATLRRFANAGYAARGQDIGAILRDYLAPHAGLRPETVCVAAAGPVRDGVARMTNLDWVIGADLLRDATGARRVEVLNDLQAQGHALGHIAAENLRPLVPAPASGTASGGGHAGAMLVLGLGTGVNAAPVHGRGAGRVVPASECGHVNMPVRQEADLRLLRFVEARLAGQGAPVHCGIEEVLSGRGLAMLHAFAADEARVESGVEGPALQSAGVLAALAAGDPVAIAAARAYTRILGQVLADLALIHLPFGGIYLIGGMARAMAPHLVRFGLAEGFRDLRRVDLLRHHFGVTLIEDDFAALTGCAAWSEALAAASG
ncbi:glucokinase [Pseudogemmobacter sonorensis]|uniref:glucokinase n=1 Tax=Pseudogemmobacter sonorensis TaxID=2989681 RepID=UPI00368092EA